MENVSKILKDLVFAARTSGGTAGPDQNLMDACERAEKWLQQNNGLINWSIEDKQKDSAYLSDVTCNSNPLTWTAVAPRLIQSYLHAHQDSVIHVIKTGHMNQYVVISENAYDPEDTKIEFSGTKQQVEQHFNIQLLLLRGTFTYGVSIGEQNLQSGAKDFEGINPLLNIIPTHDNAACEALKEYEELAQARDKAMFEQVPCKHNKGTINGRRLNTPVIPIVDMTGIAQKYGTTTEEMKKHWKCLNL